MSVNNVAILGASVSASAASTVSAPVPDLPAGTYFSSDKLKINLTSSTNRAKIYYKLNSASYKLYSSAVSISKNSTLKVYAIKNGVKSAIKTYSYKLAADIVFSNYEGYYSSTFTLKLSAYASNVKFYYTTDGSTPTTSSKKYTSSGIKLSDSCVLSVLAVKSGWAKSYISRCFIIGDDYSVAYQSGIDKQVKSGKAIVKINGKSYTGNVEFCENVNAQDLFIINGFNGNKTFYLAFDKGSVGDNTYMDKVDLVNQTYGSVFFAENFGIDEDNSAKNADYIATSLDTDVSYFDEVNILAESYGRNKETNIYINTNFHDDNKRVFDVSIKLCAEYGVTSSDETDEKDDNTGGNDNSNNDSSDKGNKGIGTVSQDGTYTSANGKFSTKEGFCSLKINGKAYNNADVYLGKYKNSVYVYVLNFNGSQNLAFNVANSALKQGASFTLDDYLAQENEEWFLAEGFPMPSTWTADNINNIFGEQYLSKVNVTYDRYDPNGIVTIYFDTKLDCGTAGITEISGYLAIDYGKEESYTKKYNDTISDNGGSGTVNIPTIDTCLICHGSKICQVCLGRRGRYVTSYGQGPAKWVQCTGCNGTGRCKYCK